MNVVSEPIVRKKLSDEVFARLKHMIETGELKAGDDMPSERELMERYGVGRPAIREAMQALATEAAPELEFVANHPMALDGHQDLFVFRKR